MSRVSEEKHHGFYRLLRSATKMLSGSFQAISMRLGVLQTEKILKKFQNVKNLMIKMFFRLN